MSISVNSDIALNCIGLICQFYEKSFSPQSAVHELNLDKNEPFERDTFLKIFKQVDLKAKFLRANFDLIRQTNLPAIVFFKDGGAAVLAQKNDDAVLLFDPKHRKPTKKDRAEFEAMWTGQLIFVKRSAGQAPLGQKFGWRWFVPAIMKYKHIYMEVILASFFLQMFALITPIFFQVIMDKVLVHRGLTTLNVLTIALVAVGIFEAILGILRTYIFAHTSSRVDVTLSSKTFHHLLHLPMGYFHNRRVGDSVARVRELETIRNFLTGSTLTLVMDLFFTFVFLIVMYIYSVTLFWVVIASLPLYAILSLSVTPLLRKRVADKFDKGAENQAFLVESITGIETIKSMALEPQSKTRWDEQIADYVTAAFRTQNLGSIASQLTQMIQRLVTAFILFFGAKLAIEGQLTVGELVAFNMLAGRVAGPVLRLSQLWQDFQQAQISVERLGDILNNPTEPRPTSVSRLPEIKGDVRYQDVIFRYKPDDVPVVNGVNLEIKAGEVIGIVGSSGSGKSTLSKLLQRLYVPESGKIVVDNLDTSLIDPAWLRRQMGVVLQENILFRRSVRENIALANPGMPMEQVISAAKLAGAHDFISELPLGYDTIIEERGSSLSGGQRQRIAIARALVTNPRILIFDEATSALDYESERMIQQNMREICKGRTVIIIAHRLAAVRDADRIVTLEKGRVVEDGPHDVLVKKNGRYAELYRMQSGGSKVSSTSRSGPGYQAGTSYDKKDDKDEDDES